MTNDTEYEVECPVCHNKAIVHHNAWSQLVCLTNDCEGHVINPNPADGEELNHVEQAEAYAHNATLTLERTRRILGDKPSLLKKENDNA